MANSQQAPRPGRVAVVPVVLAVCATVLLVTGTAWLSRPVGVLVAGAACGVWAWLTGGDR